MTAATQRAADVYAFTMGYLAAFAAIGFNAGEGMAKELADLTTTGGEMLEAVMAMKDAPVHKRVYAALDLLRAKRRTT